MLVPSGGGRWISLNTTIKPFDDVNVRKAVIAGFDRNALRQTRGGAIVGDDPDAPHPAGPAGLQRGRRPEGPGRRLPGPPDGRHAARGRVPDKQGRGYRSSGKYTGGQTFLMVGDSDGVGADTAAVAKENFAKLGFNVKLRQVAHDDHVHEVLQRADREGRDLPERRLAEGLRRRRRRSSTRRSTARTSCPQGNSNWSQLDDTKINAQMDDAKTLTDPQQISNAWGSIDKNLTAMAPTISWIWDKNANIESKNVQGVIDQDNGLWALAYTSIK